MHRLLWLCGELVVLANQISLRATNVSRNVVELSTVLQIYLVILQRWPIPTQPGSKVCATYAAVVYISI